MEELRGARRLLTMARGAVLGMLIAIGGCGRFGFEAREHGDAATGDGAVDSAEIPGVFRIATGDDHACAILAGALSCWGANSAGQLGLEMLTPSELTPRLVDGTRRWRDVTGGVAHTCAIDEAREVWCWGDNAEGQLGAGDTTPRISRQLVTLPRPALKIESMANHTCAILDDATLYCWGSNAESQLGQGGTPGPPMPSPVQVTMAWEDVACGQGHTLGLSGGALHGTGRNTLSELGLGTGASGQPRTMTPSPIIQTWRSITAGQNMSFGIATDDTLWGWGGNGAGALGLGDTMKRDLPTPIDTGMTWREVDTDTFHTCAVSNGAALWCWGRNVEGQLGIGDTVTRPTPVNTSAFADWSAVAVARFFTCGLRGDAVWCTGDNLNGCLGTGDEVRRDAWTPVVFP